MKTLTVGLDTTTQELLGQDLSLEAVEDFSDFDISDWSDNSLYELMVLNLDLVGGLMVCRSLRKAQNAMPVIGIMTPPDDRSFDECRAMFLENGGDDLIRGPSNTRLLAASARTIIRRSSRSTLSDIFTIYCGDHELFVDLAERTLRINGERFEMSSQPMRMLFYFIQRRNMIVSKDMLMDCLYAARPEDPPEIKIVDVFVCKLRFALNKVAPGLGGALTTIWGRGYRFEAAHKLKEPVDANS